MPPQTSAPPPWAILDTCLRYYQGASLVALFHPKGPLMETGQVRKIGATRLPKRTPLIQGPSQIGLPSSHPHTHTRKYLPPPLKVGDWDLPRRTQAKPSHGGFHPRFNTAGPDRALTRRPQARPSYGGPQPDLHTMDPVRAVKRRAPAGPPAGPVALPYSLQVRSGHDPGSGRGWVGG